MCGAYQRIEALWDASEESLRQNPHGSERIKSKEIWLEDLVRCL